MAYCPKCGAQVHEEAEICVHCGCRIKPPQPARIINDENNFVRFLITFFLGFIGSFIINHSSLKPVGWSSRTSAYFFLSIVTFGLYGFVASICNFFFNANAVSNVGYFHDMTR